MENSNQRGQSSPISYHFVTDQEPGQPSQVRRHVARERWKQRKAPGLSRFQRTRPRRLASAATAPRSTNSSSNSDPSPLQSGRSSNKIFIDLRHSLNKEPPIWNVSKIPKPFSRHPDPYQSLGHADFDPFNVVRLSREDQELLYHWTNVYAYQAFGQPPESDSTFLPLSNAYVPIDLSDEASTHATLAHSANHIAYLRGEPSPLSALSHKIAAIKLVNEALNDPEIAVGDGNLAAVLRLFTFERFWGTEDAARLHLKGLSQLVKQRGGFNAFHGNWRLELRVLFAPLLSKPLGALDAAESPTRGTSKPRTGFVNVFSEIAIPGPEVTLLYPAIGRAIDFLKSQAKTPSSEYFDRPLPSPEIERLMCLVYISFLFNRSQKSRFNLKWLDDFLERTEQVWFNSTSTLRWLLAQSLAKGLGGLKDGERTERLVEVARLLNLSSYGSLEERYLESLVQESPETGLLLSPVE